MENITKKLVRVFSIAAVLSAASFFTNVDHNPFVVGVHALTFIGGLILLFIN